MADEKTWPRSPKPMWSVLRVLLVLAIVIQLALIIAPAYELWRGFLTEEIMAKDLTALAIALASTVFALFWLAVFVLAVVCTCRITFRMMKNLDVLEAPGERMSPTMAVVWYFIPIASLFLPYRGFKQIWRGTFELSDSIPASDGAVGPWWLFWILSNITSTLSFRLAMQSGGMSEYGPINFELYNMSLWVGIASSALGVLACWFMLGAFGPVVRAQEDIIRTRTFD